MHQPTTPNHQNPHYLRHEVRGWACRDAVRTGCEWDEAYSGRAKALRVYEKRKPAGVTLLDITSPFFIPLLPPLLASSQSGRQLSRLDFFGTFCIKTKSTKRKEHYYAEATELYFYHPDHLGSSSWITYTDGKAIEHLHYLPYGETQVDQRATSYAARYTFSAKEKDEETGYSYFGARYYNSDLSVWLSVDPMADKYPHQSNYVYCSNNPIHRIDPNGMDDYFTDNGEFLFNDGAKSDNIRIMTQEQIDAGKNNGVIKNVEGSTTIEPEWGNTNSSAASESNLSDASQLSIYQHYNTTGTPIEAMQRGEGKNQDNGKSYGMRTTNERGNLIIQIRLDGNKNNKIFDHANEIKSIFAHEKRHVEDYNAGLRLSSDDYERNAYTDQIKHPSFCNTRQGFQNIVLKRARSLGLPF